MNRHELEICCGDIDSVKAAVDAGADRIELCSALEVGGITPSIGLLKEAIRLRNTTRIHVLIRPREGDFVYTDDEVNIMLSDIETASKCGAQGVVIGALLPDGSIDLTTCRKLMNAATGMSVTFHRAFDMCANVSEALEQIIELGCDRILTSGQANTALEGVDTLSKLHQQAENRIILIGASGVNPDNANEIISKTGLSELHASARTSVTSKMTYRNENVAMGADGSDEYTRKVTCSQLVAQLMNIVHNNSVQS